MLKLRSLPNGAGTVASLLLRVAAPAVEWQPPGTGARCQARLRREFGLLRCSRNQMEAAPKLGRNRQLSILPLLVDHPRSRFDNQRPTMKILIASTLCDGPHQPDARDLAYTSRRQPRDRLPNRDCISRSHRSQRRAIPSSSADADFDRRDLPSLIPELTDIPPGSQWLRIVCERLFVDVIPGQAIPNT